MADSGSKRGNAVDEAARDFKRSKSEEEHQHNNGGEIPASAASAASSSNLVSNQQQSSAGGGGGGNNVASGNNNNTVDAMEIDSSGNDNNIVPSGASAAAPPADPQYKRLLIQRLLESKNITLGQLNIKREQLESELKFLNTGANILDFGRPSTRKKESVDKPTDPSSPKRITSSSTPVSGSNGGISNNLTPLSGGKSGALLQAAAINSLPLVSPNAASAAAIPILSNGATITNLGQSSTPSLLSASGLSQNYGAVSSVSSTTPSAISSAATLQPKGNRGANSANTGKGTATAASNRASAADLSGWNSQVATDFNVSGAQSLSSASSASLLAATSAAAVASSLSASIPDGLDISSGNAVGLNGASAAAAAATVGANSINSSNNNNNNAAAAAKMIPPIDEELLKRQEEINRRIKELEEKGLFAGKLKPKFPEPPRKKVHWDYLLEEMQWLSTDFRQERKWKVTVARKVAYAAKRYHDMQSSKAERDAKAHHHAIRKLASQMAREVQKFWGQIEKLALHKHQIREDVRKRQVLDQQLDDLVGKAGRFSALIAADLHVTTSNVPTDAATTPSVQSDVELLEPEFQADEAEAVDDETTLEEDEKMIDQKDTAEEVVALHEESEMPIEQLLAKYGYGRDDDDEEEEEEEESEEEEEEDSDDEEEEEEEEEGKKQKRKQDNETANKSSNNSASNNNKDEQEKDPEDVEMGTQALLMSSSDDAATATTSKKTAEDTDDQGAATDEQGDAIMNDSVDQQQPEASRHHDPQNDELLTAATAAAAAAQPTGFTFATSSVKTKVPFLLKMPLREYQHIALDWLVSLSDKKLNGILADEMGLGKTVMTVALLAHLACEKGIWGPHLIVVPTSVMINWEIELKRWCPAFKVLTYYGSQKERKLKRIGWTKPNSFHVCITSYTLAVQDQAIFRRKKWKYLILDEAHNIKNFQTQRWQVLLNFPSKRRLLLTGTPLQNNLMELWSLLHFLMPHIFTSHADFKDWFSNPLTNMIEGNEAVNEDLVRRLHSVLRPFVLRRLKRDVETQLPQKHEHLVPCRLSKRQRCLYDDFMASGSTRAKLSSGNLLEIINVLMQLRKVCNHPDLFEERPIISPFDMEPLRFVTASAVARVSTDIDPLSQVSPDVLVRNLCALEELGYFDAMRARELQASRKLIEEIDENEVRSPNMNMASPASPASSFFDPGTPLAETVAVVEGKRSIWRAERLRSNAYISIHRQEWSPVYGHDLRKAVNVAWNPVMAACTDRGSMMHNRHMKDTPRLMEELVVTPEERLALNTQTIVNFSVIIPKVRGNQPVLYVPKPSPSEVAKSQQMSKQLVSEWLETEEAVVLRPSVVRRQLYFPDKRLLQYDCGKLQQMDVLLKNLKAGGHRVLIFTQMTRMLNIFETFLNFHGHTYVRLDGSTKIDVRQRLVERFNQDKRIFIFISSTRSGGLGINLTGADTVIFYDSDWNPAMDKQAQDRCHRIGQTRDVHIYRLVSEHTVEENILKKANQKRQLDDMVMQDGLFTPEFFNKMDVREFFVDSNVAAGSGSLLSAIGPSASASSSNAASSAASSSNATAAMSSVPGGEVVAVMKGVGLTAKDWEEAITSAEDAVDVIALKGARAEAASELNEFNESIPLEEPVPAIATSSSTTTAAAAASSSGPSSSSLMVDVGSGGAGGGMGTTTATAAEEFDNVEDQLMPVQKYALKFYEGVYMRPGVAKGMTNKSSASHSNVHSNGAAAADDHRDGGGGGGGGCRLEKNSSINNDSVKDVVMNEVEASLFYHVAGSSMEAYKELLSRLTQGILEEIMSIYMPPDPDEIDEPLTFSLESMSTDTQDLMPVQRIRRSDDGQSAAATDKATRGRKKDEKKKQQQLGQLSTKAQKKNQQNLNRPYVVPKPKPHVVSIADVKWTPEEEWILLEMVRQFGQTSWCFIADLFNRHWVVRGRRRSAKQCSEYFMYHLAPGRQQIIATAAGDDRPPLLPPRQPSDRDSRRSQVIVDAKARHPFSLASRKNVPVDKSEGTQHESHKKAITTVGIIPGKFVLSPLEIIKRAAARPPPPPPAATNTTALPSGSKGGGGQQQQQQPQQQNMNNGNVKMEGMKTMVPAATPTSSSSSSVGLAAALSPAALTGTPSSARPQGMNNRNTNTNPNVSAASPLGSISMSLTPSATNIGPISMSLTPSSSRAATPSNLPPQQQQQLPPSAPPQQQQPNTRQPNSQNVPARPLGGLPQQPPPR